MVDSDVQVLGELMALERRMSRQREWERRDYERVLDERHSLIDKLRNSEDEAAQAIALRLQLGQRCSNLHADIRRWLDKKPKLIK